MRTAVLLTMIATLSAFAAEIVAGVQEQPSSEPFCGS